MVSSGPQESGAVSSATLPYSDIVINLGIRYDRLDPNSTYPDPTKELGYEYTDAAGVTHTITPSSLNLLTADEKQTLSWGYLEHDESGNLTGFDSAPRAPVKDQWSPRLGVGYPITDRTAFHFSYGQFYQFPDLVNMYNYSNFQGEGISPPGWSDASNSLAKDFYLGTLIILFLIILPTGTYQRSEHQMLSRSVLSSTRPVSELG